MRDGAWAGFKYFDCTDSRKISITVRGKAHGKIDIFTDMKKEPVASVAINESSDWESYVSDFECNEKKASIFVRFTGKGAIDFKEFEITNN